jgi:hypothetical protein
MESRIQNSDRGALALRLQQLLGGSDAAPDASIIIPVSARADLETVIPVLEQISRYAGPHALELILVINNYDPDSPPAAIDTFGQMGIRVIAVPSARRPGEVVILSARALGVQGARAETTIHVDADSRIVDSTALFNWYIDAMRRGVQLAYTHVGYYDLRAKLPVRIKIGIHHIIRWFKRSALGIPTTRGGNYAVTRSSFLASYEAGRLSVDMQLGPAVKLGGGKVAYSGRRELHVLISGRKHSGSWRRLLPYLLHRLRYNLRAIPTKRRPVTRESWNGFDLETERRLRASMADNGRPPNMSVMAADEEQS